MCEVFELSQACLPVPFEDLRIEPINGKVCQVPEYGVCKMPLGVGKEVTQDEEFAQLGEWDTEGGRGG